MAMYGIELKWAANTISEGGIDWRAYNQNATMLKLAEGEHFGPAPENFPMWFS